MEIWVGSTAKLYRPDTHWRAHKRRSAHSTKVPFLLSDPADVLSTPIPEYKPLPISHANPIGAISNTTPPPDPSRRRSVPIKASNTIPSI